MGDNFLKKDFTLFAADNGVSKNSIEKYFNHINPTILEERQLNVTQMDVFSRLFMERILYVGGAIDSDVANILTSQLLYLEMQDSKSPITMYINSPGGEIYAGLAIYDTMQYVSCPISTMCTGLAASMASVLLCAGENGQRYALPHSRVMIHHPMGGIQGQASDIEITCNEILTLKNELYQIISDHSGQTIEQIQKDADRDHWMKAQEALEYGKFGIIDKIVSKK